MKKWFFPLLLILFVPGPVNGQFPCIQTPPVSEMDRQFYDSLKALVSASKVRLVLFPFQDGSQAGVDEILSKGFAYALYDLLSYSQGLGIYHPFVVLDATISAHFTNDDFFDEARVAEAAAGLKATHAVYGMFQKQPDGTLRYFIKMAAVSQKKEAYPVLEKGTEQGDRFFPSIADAAQSILEMAGGKKLNREFIQQYLKTSPTFEAYRYYVKGMEASRSYHEINLSIAKVWFEKAIALSYTFQQAYREKGRALLMTVLLHKQTGKDVTLELGEASQSLSAVHYNTGQKSLPLGPGRWYQAHLDFVAGASLLQNNNTRAAQQALTKAVARVPEDGLAHFYLAKALEAAKESKASSEMELARRLNSCIQ